MSQYETRDDNIFDVDDEMNYVFDMYARRAMHLNIDDDDLEYHDWHDEEEDYADDYAAATEDASATEDAAATEDAPATSEVRRSDEYEPVQFAWETRGSIFQNDDTEPYEMDDLDFVPDWEAEHERWGSSDEEDY